MCWPCTSATNTGISHKFSLEISRNLQQPFLGAGSPILIVPKISFEVPYVVFGGLKISRQLISNV